MGGCAIRVVEYDRRWCESQRRKYTGEVLRGVYSVVNGRGETDASHEATV